MTSLSARESVSAVVEHLATAEAARLRATLIGMLGDFDLAEEMLQEALTTALESWPAQGIPDRPRGWIVSTARFKAVDHLRRRSSWREKQQRLIHEWPSVQEPELGHLDDDHFPDDRLRLLFTCCHPALREEARIALTLRTLGGLTTEEIARAFLVDTPTMAQRIVRAQRKIRDAGIPFRIPPRSEIGQRLDGVLAVVYLIFNEGHSATAGDELVRLELCREALRLARLLVDLHPCSASRGLLGLCLLIDARRPARVDAAGDLVLLDRQDRSLWSREAIAEGIRFTELAMRGDAPAHRYALEAAIAAVHAEATSSATTDWRQIRALYDVLARVQPSPVVALNRAVAVGMERGPMAGLAVLDALQEHPELLRYHLFAAARAEFLSRSARIPEALAAFRAARELTANQSERRFLDRRIRQLESA